MSVFNRWPLHTNICKYAKFIWLFSSHWTINTITQKWQKLQNCVGLQRFMFEAWLFVLAHHAHLPNTVDFVLYDLFSIFAQRSVVEYRHLISGTRSSKYCRLQWQMLGKMKLFRHIIVFRLLIHSGLRKLWVEMVHFKKYWSFKCLVWVNSVSPFIITTLIRSKNKKDSYSRLESEFLP